MKTRLVYLLLALGMVLIITFSEVFFPDPQIEKIVEVVSWLSLAYLFNKGFKIIVWDSIVSNNLGHPTPRLLTDFFSFIVYLFSIAIILSTVYEQPITGFYTTSGVVGIILGFALKSLILDVFSGLAMNIDRPFNIDQWIMLHGRRLELHIIGCVKAMNWRTTRIQTTEGVLVVVPNSHMSTAIITNLSAPEEKSRFEFTLILNFAVPIDRAIRIITAAILDVTDNNIGFLNKPKSKVRVHEIADSGIVYRVRYWLLPSKMSPNKSRHLAMTKIVQHLRLSGITPTYPKLETSFYKKLDEKTIVNAGNFADKTNMLSNVEIFSSLSDNEIREIAKTLNVLEFNPGEKIVQKGDLGISMFVIFEGFVNILADIHNSGQEIKIDSLTTGEFFGEMSLLTGELRSATVIAHIPTTIFEISKNVLSPIIESRPHIATNIGKLISCRQIKNAIQANEIVANKTEQNVSSITNNILSFFKIINKDTT